MKKYTLVVVDMQPGFEASNKKETIKNVQREVRRAIHYKCPIIILEYYGGQRFGKTHKEIRELVKGYRYCEFVSKDDDDGSYEVIETCEMNEFPLNNFRVCGVNTTACVRDTVFGLGKRKPRKPNATVKVVKGACNCASYSNYDWNRFLTSWRYIGQAVKLVPVGNIRKAV